MAVKDWESPYLRYTSRRVAVRVTSTADATSNLHHQRCTRTYPNPVAAPAFRIEPSHPGHIGQRSRRLPTPRFRTPDPAEHGSVTQPPQVSCETGRELNRRPRYAVSPSPLRGSPSRPSSPPSPTAASAASSSSSVACISPRLRSTAVRSSSVSPYKIVPPGRQSATLGRSR